ncbi:MAG: hypothetical protein HY811_02875 [Planctomycetes bacterium]|nr:hypothetical protein [Planctomycetota bacterium]
MKKTGNITQSETTKHPDEVTDFEFINEHLYQVALRGGYQEEFNNVKARVSSLAPFKDARTFMRFIRRKKHLKSDIVNELKELWKKDYDLRPATGAVLMLAMWTSAFAAGENFWFRLFDGMDRQEAKPTGRGI